MKTRQLSKKEIAQMDERAIPIMGISVVRTHTQSRYDSRLRPPRALLLVRPDEEDGDLLPYSVEDPLDLIVSLRLAADSLEQWFSPSTKGSG